MKKRWAFFNIFVVISMVGATWLGASPVKTARGAPVLTITPITWNVIGLDSNNVNSGPTTFPVGARVCNTDTVDTATNVVSSFVWDSFDSYINLRSGSLTTESVPSLAPGACTDFYYEVAITRSPMAYYHARRYHITATADGLGTISTPTPRELYIEKLVSQNRNSTIDVHLNGTPIPNGGTMTLLVGHTYTITLFASTATNGYEQIESFINFPNTIFQILSVQTTYSVDSSAYVDNPSSMLYGDGCLWENNPASPNYRACLSTGKAGGTVTIVYQVRILSVGTTNPQPLNTLIYDYSGSSYHYNTDYSANTRFAYILSPSMGVEKSSTTTSITAAGQVVPYSFAIANTGDVALTGVTVSDPLCDAPPLYVSGDLDGDNALDLSETWRYSCNHTVTQVEIDAGGNLSNTVTVTSTESAPFSDTLDIPITQTPGLTISKQLTTLPPYLLGNTLAYSIVVSNTGNLTLTHVTVSDLSAVMGDCAPAQPASLAPGMVMNCTASHVIIQADLDAGGYSNTATVDSDQTEPASATVNVALYPTAVELNYFRAWRTEKGILLSWETVSEATLAGFNLYRREPKGDYIQINESLIPPQVGGQPEGSVYFFPDGDVSLDLRYEYRLEGIETNLQPNSYATVYYWPFTLSLPVLRN